MRTGWRRRSAAGIAARQHRAAGNNKYGFVFSTHSKQIPPTLADIGVVKSRSETMKQARCPGSFADSGALHAAGKSWADVEDDLIFDYDAWPRLENTEEALIATKKECYTIITDSSDDGEGCAVPLHLENLLFPGGKTTGLAAGSWFEKATSDSADLVHDITPLCLDNLVPVPSYCRRCSIGFRNGIDQVFRFYDGGCVCASCAVFFPERCLTKALRLKSSADSLAASEAPVSDTRSHGFTGYCPAHGDACPSLSERDRLESRLANLESSAAPLSAHTNGFQHSDIANILDTVQRLNNASTNARELMSTNFQEALEAIVGKFLQFETDILRRIHVVEEGLDALRGTFQGGSALPAGKGVNAEVPHIGSLEREAESGLATVIIDSDAPDNKDFLYQAEGGSPPSENYGSSSRRVSDLPDSEKKAFISELAAYGGLGAHELSALLFPGASSYDDTAEEDLHCDWGGEAAAVGTSFSACDDYLHDNLHDNLQATTHSNSCASLFSKHDVQTGSLSEETESEECSELELEEGAAETPIGLFQPLSAASSSCLSSEIASIQLSATIAPP